MDNAKNDIVKSVRMLADYLIEKGDFSGAVESPSAPEDRARADVVG